MSDGILVFIEQRQGQIRKASLEALSEALRQSGAVGGTVSAVVVGENVKPLTADISKYGPAKVYTVDGADFANYSTEAYTDAVGEGAGKSNARYVFAAVTAMSKDLMPRAAARMDAPCVSDVMEFKNEGAGLVPVKPMYSGKAYGAFEFQSEVALVTWRANVFKVGEANSAHTATAEELAVKPTKVRARVVK